MNMLQALSNFEKKHCCAEWTCSLESGGCNTQGAETRGLLDPGPTMDAHWQSRKPVCKQCWQARRHRREHRHACEHSSGSPKRVNPKRVNPKFGFTFFGFTLVGLPESLEIVIYESCMRIEEEERAAGRGSGLAIAYDEVLRKHMADMSRAGVCGFTITGAWSSIDKDISRSS